MSAEPYNTHVEHLEVGLGAYAKRSFEFFSPIFLDGGEYYKTFADQWQNPARRPRLIMRTPLQIERDRILYSDGMRIQTEKYHVLYNGQRRIVRNYTTHTLRTQQVTRSICRALRMNGDFAEAIALGAKTGALPFVHASKGAVSDWVVRRVGKIDNDLSNGAAGPSRRPAQLDLDFGDCPLPSWIQNLRSTDLKEKLLRYVPWAAGRRVDSAYSSGQQGYWQLSTNPYTVQSRPLSYSPEVMFGIWRHSCGLPIGKDSFFHRCPIDLATSGRHEIKWDHVTYEAIIHQYADDITWVIENLNDANHAALLNKRDPVYADALAALGGDIDQALARALTMRDASGLYTYFISDFVRHSNSILDGLGDGAVNRAALREGRQDATIGLSPDAVGALDGLRNFLYGVVFKEPRVENRYKMLSTVSVACMDLLYDGTGTEGILETRVRELALRSMWRRESIDRALNLIRDPVHRIQLCVNIFADMGDQEIYDFVGIQAL